MVCCFIKLSSLATKITNLLYKFSFPFCVSCILWIFGFNISLHITERLSDVTFIYKTMIMLYMGFFGSLVIVLFGSSYNLKFYRDIGILFFQLTFRNSIICSFSYYFLIKFIIVYLAFSFQNVKVLPQTEIVLFVALFSEILCSSQRCSQDQQF